MLVADRGGFWDAVDARLTRDRLTVYPIAVVVLFVVTWAVSLRSGLPLPDHLSRWTSGRLVLDGAGSATLYDPGVQSALQSSIGSASLSWFVSPPFVALLFVPFGALPYPVSAAVWTVVSVVATVWALRAAASLHPALSTLRRRGALVVALSCQPVLELVGGGQDSGVILAAVVGTVLLRGRGRSFLAGLVLATTLVKPQLAVVLPLALLLLRDWRAIAGLVTGAVGLAAAATAAFGVGIWEVWLRTLRSPLYLDEVVAGQAWKNTTVHGLVESLVPGTGGWVVLALWGLLTAAVLVLTLRRWRTPRPKDASWLLLVVAPAVTVLITPHAMVYDLVLLLPGALWLVASAGSPRIRGLLVVAYVLLFLAPVLRLATATAPWPLSVFAAPWVVVVLGFLWWGWLRSSPRRQQVPADAGEAVVKRS